MTIKYYVLRIGIVDLLNTTTTSKVTINQKQSSHQNNFKPVKNVIFSHINRRIVA